MPNRAGRKGRFVKLTKKLAALVYKKPLGWLRWQWLGIAGRRSLPSDEPVASVEPFNNVSGDLPSDSDGGRLLFPGETPSNPGRYYLDLLDAVDYFAESSRPSGIQRVQLESLRALLVDRGQLVRPCVYSRRRRGWIELPESYFIELYAAVEEEGDKRRRTAMDRIRMVVDNAPLLDFPAGAALINLGTSWSAEHYFDDLQALRIKAPLAYIPMVHDLIPARTPQYCAQGTVAEFMLWISRAIHIADCFVTSSENTKADLIGLAAFMGKILDGGSITVARLDTAFNREPSTPGDRTVAERLGVNRPYVLFVGTLEPRKNHLAAFQAWRALETRLGKRTPTLVCVGKWGWHVEAIRAAHDAIGDLVKVVSGLTDAELAGLYSGALFTLYPSHYEGWGLPVTESLSYGKLCLTARNSALVEAGGTFAEYFEDNDVGQLAERAERLITDRHYLDEREAHIAANFRPRSWGQFAEGAIQAADAAIARLPL